MTDYKTRLIADTSQHDQALKKSAQEVYSYKRKAEETDKSVGNLIGKFKKFVGVLSVAKVASDGFNSIMQNNQSVADNWGASMEVCKRISDEFFYSISKADFTTMLDGLGRCISAAKDYYNALDNLQTLQLGLIGENARLDSELQAARLRVRQGDTTAVADIERISSEMLANVQRERKEIQNTLDAMIKNFSSGAVGKSGRYKVNYDRGFDVEDIQKWVSDQSKLTSEIIRAKSEMERLKKTASEYNSINGIHHQAAYAEAYYKALVRIQDWMSDGENLNQFEQQYKSMYALTSQYNQMQQRNLRYTKELGADNEKQTPKTPKITPAKTEVEVDPILPEGSIAALQKELSGLKLQFNLATTDAEREGLKNKMEAVQADIDRMEGKTKVEVEPIIPEGSIAYINQQITELKRQYELTPDGEIRLQIKADINNLEKQLETITTDPAQKEFEELNAKVKESRDEINSWFDGVVNLGQGISSLGSLFNDESSKMLDGIGRLTSQIAQMIPSILGLIGAEEGEALAAGTASAAKIPYPANIAAIASVVAQLMGVFSTIGSLTTLSKYADGGIITGATSIGDYNLARVNSGEMILNSTQQSRLFRTLNQGSVFVEPTAENQVTFHISGHDLFGVLNNYQRKRNRVL